MSPHPIHILVVDDEQELCALSKGFLERSQDLEVETAGSVAEARIALDRKHYDIIVSDYQMPNEDGIQFLKSLRGQGDPVPFILFTGKGREEVVIEALNSGADSYLQKGGHPKPLFTELEHRVRVAVHRRRAEDALQESEERYKRISESTTDFVFSCLRPEGGDYSLDWMAGDVEGILGYSIEEMRAMRCWGRLVIPEDIAAFQENVMGLPLGTSQDSMLRIRTKGGDVRWLAVNTTHAPSIGIPSHDRVFGGCTDITERKRAEEALHISEDRFHELAELLPATIFEMDLRGVLTYWNRQAYAMLGPTVNANESSIPALDMLMPAERERGEGNFRRVLEGEDIGPIEYELRRTDGSSFSALVNATTILHNERPVGIRGVMVDITGRKRAEQALLDSEARFKQLAEHGRIVTWEIDGNGLFTYVSNVSETAWGYRPDELVGKKHFFDLVPEAYRASIKAMIAEAFPRQERFVDLEGHIMTKDGQMRWVATNGIPLLNEDGSLRGYQGSETDITERKHAEEALKRSESRLRAILDATPFPIAIVDLQDENIYFWSRSARAIFGHTAPTAAEWYDLAYPDQEYRRDVIDRWKTSLQSARASGQPVNAGEYRITCYDGSFRICELYATIMADSLIVTFNDVTERKRAEESLQRQSAMLALLNEIISAANRTEDLSQLLSSTLEGSLRLLDFDAGGIYLVDRSSRTASVVCSNNLPPEFLARTRTLPIDERPYDTLFIKNEPLISDDYAQINPELADEFELRSMASIPISSKRSVIGALNVASLRRHMISEDEKQVLISICRELGSSIERQVSEGEAKKAVKNLESLFHSIEEMVFVLDMQGRILAVNDAVQKRLSRTSEELVGTNVLFLHVPERRDEALQIVQGMIAGTTSSCTVPLLAKDGNRIEVETKVARGRWNGQEVLFGVSRDITERKRAEQALQESEDKYRLLVQNANMAIVVLQGGTTVLVNPIAIEKMGFSEQELRSRHFISFVHPEDRAMVMERYQMRLQGMPSPDHYEARILTERGDVLWVEVHVAAIIWGGRPAALNFLSDITERKQLEKALHEAGRKLNLLSGVTRHDITNQLLLLKGRLALLEMEDPGPSRDEHLHRAEVAAEQISTMVQFTKEYEDIGMKAPTWVCPKRQMAGIFAALRPAGVTLVDDTGDLEVLADPLVEKVPYNLIDNSIRHGEHVTRIRMSSEQRGDAMLIVYEDDGAGISDDDRERLFEKGFGKNTGFGLFLCREILAITGITITENGKAGEGVRFEMLVPAGAWRQRP